MVLGDLLIRVSLFVLFWSHVDVSPQEQYMADFDHFWTFFLVQRIGICVLGCHLCIILDQISFLKDTPNGDHDPEVHMKLKNWKNEKVSQAGPFSDHLPQLSISAAAPVGSPSDSFLTVTILGLG